MNIGRPIAWDSRTIALDLLKEEVKAFQSLRARLEGYCVMLEGSTSLAYQTCQEPRAPGLSLSSNQVGTESRPGAGLIEGGERGVAQDAPARLDQSGGRS